MPRLLPLLLAFLAVWPALPSPVAAQSRAPLAAIPPQPMPITVQVRRDEKPTIVLRIYGGGQEMVQFRLRTRPQHGTVSEPKNLTVDTASVIYDPPDDLSITKDRFSYAVKAAAGVSAPADVEITIVDDAPLLIVPDLVDFGEVLVGTEAVQELTIENRGGGLAEGQIDPPDGWRVEGERLYRLRRGQTHTFRLVFSPGEETTRYSELRYTAERDRFSVLRGTGVGPVTVEPAKIRLSRPPPGTGTDIASASVEVRNHTAEPQEVDLFSSERVEISEETLQLPPHGTARVDVRTRPGDARTLDGEIQIIIGEYEKRFSVTAPPLGPKVRVRAMKLDLRAIPPDARQVVHLPVENTGGQKATVSVKVTPPLSTPQASVEIAPGEVRKIPIAVKTIQQGLLRAEVTIEALGERMVVPVEGIITPLSESEYAERHGITALQYPRVTKLRPLPERTAANDRSRRADGPKTYSYDVEIQKLEPRLAEVTWRKRLRRDVGTVAGWQVERQSLSIGSKGEPVIGWTALPNVEVQDSGKTVTATLRNLSPRTHYVLRMVPLLPAGEIHPPMDETQFTTPPTYWSTIRWKRWILWSAVVALVAMLVVRRLREQ